MVMDHSRKVSDHAGLCECFLEYLKSNQEKLRDSLDNELSALGLKVLYSKSKTLECID